MKPHDELLHYGIKGMRWGVRKASAERTTDKISKLHSKAAKYDKKAGKIEKRVVRKAVDTYVLGNTAFAAFDKKTKITPKTVLDVASGHQSMRQMKYEVKAEDLRRKAARLSRKLETTHKTSMSSIDSKKTKRTFDSIKSDALSAIKDRHNQKKALVTTNESYKAYKVGKAAYKTALFAAGLKLAYDGVRRYKNLGKPILPAMSLEEQAKKVMKSGKMYVVDYDGVIRKYSMKAAAKLGKV